MSAVGEAGPTPVAGSSSDAAASPACASCGHPLPGRYCPACGQKTRTGRFTVRSLLREAFSAFDLDRGLVRTAVDLTVRPGLMGRAYLAGRTRVYSNPVKYLLLAVAISVFLFHLSGFLGTPVVLGADAGEGTLGERQARLFDLYTRFFNVFLLLMLPFQVLACRWLFAAAGLNLAEHGIFNTFAFGHMNVLAMVTLPVYSLLEDAAAYTLLYTMVSSGYFLFAIQRFYGVGWPTAIWKGVAVTLIALAGYIVLLTALASVYLRIG